MTKKTGIVKRTMRNNPRFREESSGIAQDLFDECVQMPTGRNATYGMQDFANGMMRAVILDTSVGGAANGINDAAEALNKILMRPVPSDQWFSNILSKTDSEAAIKSFTATITGLLSLLAKINQLPKEGLDIAFDIHKICRYDRKPGPELTSSKSKNGTSKFERYITAQCVNNDMRLILGCCPMPGGASMPDMVRDIIDMCCDAGTRINTVLLDREFFSTGVLEVLDELNVTYLMPCTNTKGVVNALNEFAAGKRQKVSENYLKGSGRCIPYTIIIDRRKKEKKNSSKKDKKKGIDSKKEPPTPEEMFIGFATNDAYMDIAKYSSRWGIETGYAMVENMRAKTRSRDAGARLLCFLYSLMLFNGWVMINALKQYRLAELRNGKKITQNTLKFMLIFTLNDKLGNESLPE